VLTVEHANFATGTYDSQTPSTPAELPYDLINTTYCDWVRGCRLVPIEDE
jgi:hypothetical protein